MAGCNCAGSTTKRATEGANLTLDWSMWAEQNAGFAPAAAPVITITLDGAANADLIVSKVSFDRSAKTTSVILTGGVANKTYKVGFRVEMRDCDGTSFFAEDCILLTVAA